MGIESNIPSGHAYKLEINKDQIIYPWRFFKTHEIFSFQVIMFLCILVTKVFSGLQNCGGSEILQEIE